MYDLYILLYLLSILNFCNVRALGDEILPENIKKSPKNTAKSYNKPLEKLKNLVEAALNELRYSFTPDKLDV